MRSTGRFLCLPPCWAPCSPYAFLRSLMGSSTQQVSARLCRFLSSPHWKSACLQNVQLARLYVPYIYIYMYIYSDGHSYCGSWSYIYIYIYIYTYIHSTSYIHTYCLVSFSFFFLSRPCQGTKDKYLVSQSTSILLNSFLSGSLYTYTCTYIHTYR